jgi:glycerophosphoryl diester phosphodiesterase
MKIVDGAEDFPEDDILNYVKLSLDFQKEKLEDNGENQNNRVILISHRGITKTATENSLNAFKAAYEA